MSCLSRFRCNPGFRMKRVWNETKKPARCNHGRARMHRGVLLLRLQTRLATFPTREKCAKDNYCCAASGVGYKLVCCISNECQSNRVRIGDKFPTAITTPIPPAALHSDPGANLRLASERLLDVGWGPNWTLWFRDRTDELCQLPPQRPGLATGCLLLERS